MLVLGNNSLVQRIFSLNWCSFTLDQRFLSLTSGFFFRRQQLVPKSTRRLFYWFRRKIRWFSECFHWTSVFLHWISVFYHRRLFFCFGGRSLCQNKPGCTYLPQHKLFRGHGQVPRLRFLLPPATICALIYAAVQIHLQLHCTVFFCCENFMETCFFSLKRTITC